MSVISNEIKNTELKIKIKTNGALKTYDNLPIPFHPNMVDMKDLKNNKKILFTDLMKITKKDLENASKSTDSKYSIGEDLKKVFTTLDLYTKLLTYITSKDRENDDSLIVEQTTTTTTNNNNNNNENDNALDLNSPPTTKTILKPGLLTTDEIITNNIALINSIFFPLKEKFFILGREYLVVKSVCVFPPTKSIDTIELGTVKLTKSYTVTIRLTLIDTSQTNADLSAFGQLNCQFKKESLKKDIQEVFGIDMGYKTELDQNSAAAAAAAAFSFSSHTKEREFGKQVENWETNFVCQSSPVLLKNKECRENPTLNELITKSSKLNAEYKDVPVEWTTERTNFDNKLKLIIAQILKLKTDINKYGNTPDDYNQTIVDALTKQLKEKIKELLVPTATGAANNTPEIDAATTALITIEKKANEISTYFETKLGYLKEDTIKEDTTLGPLLTLLTLLLQYKKQETDKIDEKYSGTFIVKQEIEKKLNNVRNITAELTQNKNDYVPNTIDKYSKTGIQQKIKELEFELVKAKSELFPMLRQIFSIADVSKSDKQDKLKLLPLTSEEINKNINNFYANPDINTLKKKLKQRWNAYLKEIQDQNESFNKEDKKEEEKEYIVTIKAKLDKYQPEIKTLKKQLLYKKFETGLISEPRLLPKNVLAEFKSITPEKPNPALETDKTVEEINELLQKKINEYFTLIQNTYTNASQNSQLKILLLNQIISFITSELSYITGIIDETNIAAYDNKTGEKKTVLDKNDYELLIYKKKEFTYLIKRLEKYRNPKKSSLTSDELNSLIDSEFKPLLDLEDLNEDTTGKPEINKLIDDFKSKYADIIKKKSRLTAGYNVTTLPAEINGDINELSTIIQNILTQIKDKKGNNKNINYDQFYEQMKNILVLDTAYKDFIDYKKITTELNAKLNPVKTGGKRTKRRVKHKKMAKKHTRSKRAAAAAAAVAVKNRTKRKPSRHYKRIKNSIKKYKR